MILFPDAGQPGPVTVILRVGSSGPVPTTLPAPTPGPSPAPAPVPGTPSTPGLPVTPATPAVAVPVAHRSLPLTGAPVMMELSASLGLLVAGALAAWSATRRQRSPGRS